VVWVTQPYVVTAIPPACRVGVTHRELPDEALPQGASVKYRRILGASAALPLVLAMAAAPGGAAPPGLQPATPVGSSFFLTAPSSAPAEDIALSYLTGNADDFDVEAGDLEELHVLSSVPGNHGVTHVNAVQRLQGLQVMRSHATVSITADGEVLHVAAGFQPGVAAARAAARAEVTPVEAVEAAAAELDIDGADDATAGPSARSAEQATVVETRAAAEPVEARKVWQPTDKGLRLAWELVIDEAEDDHLWHVTVDALTGETLEAEDWTDHHDAHALAHNLARDPAVFAGTARASMVGSQAGAWMGGSSDPVLDGSSYNVFALPKESPNDGGMTLVENPADALASPFGWHDVDGASGAEHTTTRGNNVHAYTDQDANNVPDTGSDPDGGPGLTFDFDADLTEHAQAYREAAVTNLFYANNVIHDVLYRYGFDEASGNFQVNNYGRGGTGGDDVRAEAADGGGTNNANFSTPAADGGRPRMQMYLWPGNQFGAQNTVTVGTGEDALTFGGNYARFTPPATNAGLSAPLVDVADPCVPFEATGAIAVLPSGSTGGSCSNFVRVQNAEDAGAVGVIAYGGTSAGILSASSSMVDPVAIPAVTVSGADGQAIRDAVAAGTTAGGFAKASSHPGIRDGDFENGIIIHEYGHGVSNRLTGGLNINCLGGQEQMGEGWSDYLAIAMLIDPALDNPEGARGMGPYALFQDDRSGNGIRPRPYSRTMDIQPFTYDRIKTDSWITGTSLATPHGVGHAWSAVLWDMTWDLIDKHGFEPDLYGGWDGGGNTRGLQYVMDGMKFQGCFPGFVAGRDGILAAVAAAGGEDTCTVWSAFARRGLGASAVQGTTNRDDNTEAFDIPAECVADGAGIVGAGKVAGPPAVNTLEAGDAVPVQFNLGGDRGLDVLKDAQSPAYQQVDCDTLEPVQFATTQPAGTTGNRPLTYNARQQRYQLNWKTEESMAGTCQELQIVLEDGTQHRGWFAFDEAEEG
jgi:extracellular elastinolytic metalloproteinase